MGIFITNWFLNYSNKTHLPIYLLIVTIKILLKLEIKNVLVGVVGNNIFNLG